MRCCRRDRQLAHRYLHGPASQVPATADLRLVDEVFAAAGQSADTLWLLTDHQNTVRDIRGNHGLFRKALPYERVGPVPDERLYARSHSLRTHSSNLIRAQLSRVDDGAPNKKTAATGGPAATVR